MKSNNLLSLFGLSLLVFLHGCHANPQNNQKHEADGQPPQNSPENSPVVAEFSDPNWKTSSSNDHVFEYSPIPGCRVIQIWSKGDDPAESTKEIGTKQLGPTTYEVESYLSEGIDKGRIYTAADSGIMYGVFRQDCEEEFEKCVNEAENFLANN